MQPQPFGPQPGWPTPPPPPPTNGNAVAALVLGILSIVGCQLFGVVGLVLGLRARRQIRESNGAESGDAVALAGVVTSAIGIFLIGLAVVVILAVTLLGRSSTSTFEQVRPDPSRPAVPTTEAVEGGTGGPAEVTPPAPGAAVPAPTPCPASDGSSARATTFAAAPPMCIDPAVSYTATFETTEGSFAVALDAATMPTTTNNFVVLARYHYYDGTSVFRIDPSIDVFQGGSPATNSASDPGAGDSIDDEGGPFTYTAGDLVMARTQAPDSTAAQFFVATGPKVAELDPVGTYLRFGHVTEGMEVVEAIAERYVPYPTGSPNAVLGGGPSVPVIVTAITITER